MDVSDVPAVPEWLPDHLRADGIESLYPPQAEAVEAGVTEGHSLVASIPTASGKTLVATLAMLSAVRDGGTALYIVPLRALASEKRAEFEAFEEYGVSVGVSTGNYESSGEWLAERDIVVATSEKVDSLVRNGAPWIDDLDCVVADEVHLVDDPNRGPTLEVTLAKLRSRNPGLQVVALSATVGNAGELADWLDAELVDSDWRPIDLRKGVHYGQALHFDDGSQAELRVKSSEKPTAAIVRDTLQNEIENFVVSSFEKQRKQIIENIIESSFWEDSHQRSVRDEIQNLVVKSIIYRTVEEQGLMGIALVDDTKNARQTASKFSEQIEPYLLESDTRRLRELSDRLVDINNTETGRRLADIIKGGAAFYSDNLSTDCKKEIRAAAKAGYLKVIVSTQKIDLGEGMGVTSVTEGGSTLVFVNSRRNAEAAARRLGSTVSAELDGDELAALGEIADEIRGVSDTETSDDLADAVEQGVAFHHAGCAAEHRSLVEEAFRDRLVKCVCATPTLAAGVNTPSRRVVVRDWRRYSGDAGGMQPLSVLEVHQMMGRAGRPGMDPYGEALLLANSHDELDELFERYVWAAPEPVRSKLAAEPAMRTHLLATVASGFADSREGLREFLEGTLYATQTDEQGRLERVMDDMLAYLKANDFVEEVPSETARDGRPAEPGAETDSGRLKATGLGHTVSRLYLDPMSAATIVDGLAEADDPTALGLYHLVCRTPDMYQLYLRSGEREEYTMEAYEREDELLGDAPSEFEESRFDDWLAALKTARLLEDWAAETDEDRITDRYGVGPGDVRGKVDTAEWLLGAAESLASELDLGNAVAVREAKKRVQYGVREELIDLAGVRAVGRVRARRLYEAGIETRSALRNADKSVVLAALKGRRATAETVLENAGHQEPDMDGVTPDPEATPDDGDDEPAVAAADEEDQSSLGDF